MCGAFNGSKVCTSFHLNVQNSSLYINNALSNNRALTVHKQQFIFYASNSATL